jgi:hypothetical protein
LAKGCEDEEASVLEASAIHAYKEEGLADEEMSEE